MENTPKHKLKLTVEVEATSEDIHASKAVLAASGRSIAMNFKAAEGFGPITLDVVSVHVSEKMARKVVKPESHEEPEPRK